MKKKVLFAAAFMLATVGAYAQGNGIAGITEATNMVTSYFDPGTKFIRRWSLYLESMEQTKSLLQT